LRIHLFLVVSTVGTIIELKDAPTGTSYPWIFWRHGIHWASSILNSNSSNVEAVPGSCPAFANRPCASMTSQLEVLSQIHQMR
jgi:hypothetical protein